MLGAAQAGAIDRALPAWLPPSIASSIERVWRTRPGSDPEIWDDPYIADYRLADDLKADVDAARTALALLDLLDVRAPRREYAKAVGRLWGKTVSRALTAEDLALQIETIATELTDYPLDVAREACNASARGQKFFPAWAELRALCEDGVCFRRGLVHALRAYIELVERREAKTKALPPKEPPACAVWRDNAAALKAELGQAARDAWLTQATPDSDDGKTLVLAVPSRLIGLIIREKFGTALERILDRRVKFVVKP